MNDRKPKEPFVLHGSDEPHLKKIPPRLVEPLCLAHAGNSYGHIATELLKIPVGTVKSRINRARERILQMRTETQVEASIAEEAE